MTINSLDELVDAMGNNASRIVLDKANIAGGQTAGTFVSMWRANGQPGAGAIPSAVAVCDNTLVGSIPFTQQTSPSTTYGGWLNAVSSNAAQTLEIHDRLMQRGGLVGNVTTPQSVGLDIFANTGVDNMAARMGDSNFSDIQWWMEWYTATGSTATVATIDATLDSGATTSFTVSLAASRPIAHFLPLNSFLNSPGNYIRSINTVTLSVSTGIAGNFGFTATRPRMTLPLNIPNKMETADWQALGLPEIVNSSCLFPIILTSTSSSGTLRGGGKLIHG